MNTLGVGMKKVKFFSKRKPVTLESVHEEVSQNHELNTKTSFGLSVKLASVIKIKLRQ
jgi:hypothetical protein